MSEQFFLKCWYKHAQKHLHSIRSGAAVRCRPLWRRDLHSMSMWMRLIKTSSVFIVTFLVLIVLFLVFDQNVFLRKNLQVVFSKCSCHFCMFANKLHAMCHLMHHQLQLVNQITRSKMNKFFTNNILKIRCRMLKWKEQNQF